MNIDVVNLIVGIAGLVVGIVGIYFTVLSSPAALQAIGSAYSRNGLPAEFKGFSGAATIFMMLLLMAISYVFLCAGLIAVFSILFHVSGFSAATMKAFLFIMWINVLAMTVTASIFKPQEGSDALMYLTFVWIAAVLISIGCGIASLPSQSGTLTQFSTAIKNSP